MQELDPILLELLDTMSTEQAYDILDRYVVTLPDIESEYIRDQDYAKLALLLLTCQKVGKAISDLADEIRINVEEGNDSKEWRDKWKKLDKNLMN